MYYIYYPYVLIISMAMAGICYKQKKPLWWSAVVLFAPVTTPYFIVKSEKKGKWMTLFLLSFLLVAGAEGYIWYKEYKQDQIDRLHPVDRTAIRLTNIIEANFSEMNAIMKSLDIKDTIASGKKDIITSKDSIKRGRILIKQSQKATKQFAVLVTDYAPYFQKTHQNWALELKNFYQSRHMVKYYSTTKQYLEEFEKFLNYVQTHFEEIRNHKSRAMENYDHYFIGYRRGLDRYQKYGNERMKAQMALTNHYPELKKYLPEKIQKRAVNVWK